MPSTITHHLVAWLLLIQSVVGFIVCCVGGLALAAWIALTLTDVILTYITKTFGLYRELVLFILQRGKERRRKLEKKGNS